MLYYLTFGTYPGLEKYSLQYSPAGDQKAKYIIEKLIRIGRPFEAISLSETASKRLQFLPTKSVSCGEKGKYTVWNTFGKPNCVFRKIHYLYRLYQLKKFLSGLTSKDIVIAYHSLITAKMLFEAKQARKFKLILELEEVYQDVVSCSNEKALYEKKIIEIADAYVLATQELSEIIQKDKKYIVINGTYHNERLYHVSFNDDKIHCIYAGTFDPTKGGAAAAAAAAAYLPPKYHIHILGFGTDIQKRKLLKQIEQVKKRAVCTISYDGLKSGNEYIQFLQKCQIGLCTQIPDAKYVKTSFPSKILVYLANGLQVVSVRIPSIENSEVGDLLYYYDQQDPRKIAETIMRVDITSRQNGRKRLSLLDDQCEKKLKSLIGTF